MSLAEDATATKPPAAEGVATVAPLTAPVANIGDQITRDVRAVMEKSQSAICRIEGTDEHGTLRGTGFFVDADGTLITSYSIGGQSEDLVVTFGEEKFPASRRAADPRSGLAILKIEAGEPVPFLRLGKSSELGVASAVVALGYPLEFPLSPSFGLIAGFDFRSQNRYFRARHMRANLVVQRGQGGSPVFSLNGDVVGLLISSLEEGSGVYALPIEVAAKALRDLQLHGRIRQGWIGVSVRRTDAPEFGSSARVRLVSHDSPGRKGGIRAGDVLLKIGDRKIACAEEVPDASLYITAGEPMTVEVSRAGKRQEFLITPGDLPAETSSQIERTAPAGFGSNGMEFGKEK